MAGLIFEAYPTSPANQRNFCRYILMISSRLLDISVGFKPKGFLYISEACSWINVKVKFTAASFASSSYLEGYTDKNDTSFLFLRLGDT